MRRPVRRCYTRAGLKDVASFMVVDTYQCLNMKEEHAKDAMTRSVEIEEIDQSVLNNIRWTGITKDRDIPQKQRKNHSANDDVAR